MTRIRTSKTRTRYQLPVDKSQCKCLADVVLLYIRYACPKLNSIAESKTYVHTPDNQVLKLAKDNAIDREKRLKTFQDYAEHLYTETVRGEIIGNPRVVTAGVLYVAAVLTKTYVSQQDIAELLGIADTSVRSSYLEIKRRVEERRLSHK